MAREHELSNALDELLSGDNDSKFRYERTLNESEVALFELIDEMDIEQLKKVEKKIKSMVEKKKGKDLLEQEQKRNEAPVSREVDFGSLL